MSDDARAMHLAKVRKLETAGWHQADYYPAAGVSIMVRGEQTATILKNGKVLPGTHPPRS